MKMDNKWFGLSAGKVSIFGEIGGFGVSGKDFIDQLNAIRPCEELEIEVSSPGGSVIDGLMIFDALRDYPAKKTAKVLGWAASMGSVIVMAADKISMSANSFLMIHKPWMSTMGNSDQLRKDAEILDKMESRIMAAYMRHAKINEDELRKKLEEETWLSADEALAMGLCHEVTGELEIAAKYDVKDAYKIPEKAKGWVMENEIPDADAVSVDEGSQHDKVEPVVESDSVPKSELERAEGELDAIKGHYDGAVSKIEALDKLIKDKDLEISQGKAKIEKLEKSISDYQSKLDKAHNEAGELREKLNRLTSGGMNFEPDSGVETWKQALDKCNGDYVLARKKYPSAYGSYMSNYINKKK